MSRQDVGFHAVATNAVWSCILTIGLIGKYADYGLTAGVRIALQIYKTFDNLMIFPRIF